MIRAYSQRVLPPFSGVVLIAESDRARAQSFDGVSWEIQYLSGNDQANRQHKRQQGYGLDRGYFRVANLQNDELTPYIFPACSDSADITDAINELYVFLSTAKIPFPAADIYEYWLLDNENKSPLALIFSCCEELQMASYPSHTEWTALPHSKLKVENTAEEQSRNEAPINHRFQKLITDRAGYKPRGAWFQRRSGDAEDFPSFLVSEDWNTQEEREICQRYVQRMAPRLLMLHGLPHSDRERLEIAAKDYVFEVEQNFPMYPDVNDEMRMTAMRVEARLRRDVPLEYATDKPEKTPKDKTFSKDMRILE